MNLYIGNNYHQICDSSGSHNLATLTDLGDGTTHMSWLPTIRSGGWDNIYCWNSMPLLLPSTTGADIGLMVDVNILDTINLNAFEFEVQAIWQKRLYNMAWQFIQSTPSQVSTFDFGHSWVPAFSLPESCITARKWTRFCALYEMIPAGPHHVGVQYNNQYTPVDIQRPWVPKDAADSINFAWQFDSKNKGTIIDAVVGARLVVIERT